MGATAAIIGAVTGVASAVTQRREARTARREQQRASALENAQANLARQREIRQRLAQARIIQAEQQAAGFAAGSPGSSIVQGAVSGAGADFGANVGFAGQQGALETARIGALNRAAGAQSRFTEIGTFAQGIQSVADLATDQNISAFRDRFGF